MEVLQRTANRGSISTGLYEIDNSLKMEADNSESMARTPSSAGNRKTWTLSFWFKRTELGAAVRLFEAWDGSTGTSALFTDADLFILDLTAGGNYFTSTAVFRDTSAWSHFVIRVDTTQGTASERARVYVNGSELAGSWNSNIGQNTDLTWNQDVVHYLGVFHNTGNFANGYYAEVINVDGTSLAPTAFGEVDSDSGIWKPIDANPTYGTNGFKLEFKTSGGLGADTSGNGHTWTLNNIAAADQATDTPTNNFCTMNVLKGGINLSGTVYNRLPLMTEGATVVGNNSTNYTFLEATMGVTSGKWYWEMKPTVDANTLVSGAGIASNTNLGFSSTDGVGNFFYHYSGSRYVNGAATGYGAAWATNDIIGFAYDADNWTLTCYINNSSQGNLLASQADLSAELFIPYMYSYGTHTYQWNFGGYHANSLSSAASDANGYGTFEYAPPTGYYALCTKNLAEYG